MYKYHHIQYVDNKYIPVFLTLFWAIFFLISLIFIFNNHFIIKLFSENIIGISIIIYLFVSMFLIINYGIKIFIKKLNIIIKDEHLDINEGEKIIYFKDIKTIKLETIKNKRANQITGYTLILEWNNEKIRIIIYTGTSKAEKRNCDALLNFHEELNIKCNKNNDVRQPLHIIGL